jgi:hypothetical protein
VLRWWWRSRVVRAGRLEVVDHEGRARVVVGVLGAAGDGGQVIGADLFDGAGRSRASLVLDDGGVASLSFASLGNEVLVLGARECPGSDDGPFAVLCLADGRVAASVGVDGRGRLVVCSVEPRSC